MPAIDAMEAPVIEREPIRRAEQSARGRPLVTRIEGAPRRRTPVAETAAGIADASEPERTQYLIFTANGLAG